MKKIYSLILVAASLAVAACQPKELDDIVPDVKPDVKSVKIIATIEDIDATKVDYDFLNDNSIKPTWAQNDTLFGFDENGVKFTYKVKDIVGDEATIEDVSETPYRPELGTTVYGIYYPGKGVGDITGATGEESLAIDLAGQDGTLSGTSPAIMCATATVTEGADGNEIRFKFKNQTAIIGLTKIQVGSKDSSNLQVNTPVTQIAIEGVVTHGSLSVVNDSLTLTPGTKASTVYAVPATSSWETDDKGQIDFVTEFNAPIAFAVLPKESSEPTVYAYTSTAAFKNSKAVGSKEMAAGHYYYMSKKLDASAEPVASLTVGGVTSKYYSVSDAFDAADCSNEDCTVKLLNNCSTTRNPQIRGTNGSGDITIDLNGKTLTMSHQFGVYDSNITICDSSSVVLANQGKITSAVSTVASYFFSGSSLTLEGGTLENTANQIALYLTSSSSAVLKGGCVKSDENRAIYVNACSLSVPANSTVLVTAKNHSIYSANGTANIAGGHFDSGNGGSPAVTSAGSSSEVTITGGYFSTEHTVLLGVSSSGKFYVSGGSFSAPLSTARAVDKEQNLYNNTLNTVESTKAKYPFTLSAPGTYAALVSSGSTNYQCDGIECAIKAADVNAKATGISNISLNDDCGATDAMTISSGNTYGVTLDLNGYTVSATGVSPLIAAASDFTLMDSDGAGELITTGNVAMSVTAGTTTINSGSLVGATNAVSVAADATLTVNNGYFYGAEDGVDVAGAVGAGITLNGGWYRNEPSSDYLVPGTSAISGTEIHNNLTYNWTIGVKTAIVEVNEVGYASLSAAVAAANAFDGEAATVTIKLLGDISYDSQINLTNENDIPIVLDLNGHTLSTSTAQFITATGTSLVTIKDSEEPKGMITSTAENIISLTTANAKIKLDGCIIESKANASESNLDAPILLNYTSSTDRPQLTIENGAQVYTEKAITAIYGKYSQLNLNSCEITSGTQESGRYGVFVTTGLILNVNANASIYSTGSSAIYCGSGNAATSIQINGGYLYGTPAALTAGNSGAYSARFTINGGFFNTDVSTISGSTAATINGSIIPCTDGFHTPQPTGAPLVYSYKFTTSVAEVNGQGYDTLADAVADAKSGSSDATITLLTDITYDADATITLNNTNTKIVTLDLYGHILTAGAEKFIKGTKFTITDSKGTGKIESAYNDIIYPNYATSVVTLKGCKIVSTLAKGTNYYSSRAVNCTNKCTLTVTDGTVIEAKQTGIYCSGADSPKVIINDAKITSTGSYCIYVSASGEVTVEDGTFHSTGYICGYIGNANATFTIKHGYFSTGSTSSLLYGATGAREDRYSIQGGYYSKALHNSISGYDTVVQLSSPVTIDGITYTHAHTSELQPSEASVEASTSEPVVTLGEARNGGVSF